jgi:hypothetical protein
MRQKKREKSANEESRRHFIQRSKPTEKKNARRKHSLKTNRDIWRKTAEEVGA